MPHLRRIVVLGLAAAAFGCGPTPPADGNSPPDTLSTDAAPLSDTIPLLVLQQEGGIAGATSELTIFRTGEATLAQDPAPGGIPVRRWTLAGSDFAAIDALVRSSAFQSLGAEYLPENTCCDRITYTISVPGIDGSHTIRTMDAAPQPDALSDLLERLSALEATAPQ